MIDMTWLSSQANTLHAYFSSLFYAFVTLFLIVGVLVQFFQFPIGGIPGIGPLVGRALVAAILLATYPEVSKLIAELADALASKLGDLNQFKFVLGKMADKLHEFSWNWVSIKGSLVLALSFLTFFLLYFSVHVTQSFLIYTWTVLYVFSPLLIALYVLPQTSSATKALYQSLFEASSWKVVWAVLATLLWSTGVSDISQQNIIASICFNLILAGSLVLTPIVVHMLTKGGIASMAKTVGSVAVGGITTVTPGKVVGLAASMGKHGYNQSLNAASMATNSMPRVQKAIESAPRFRVPERRPIFEKKNEENEKGSKKRYSAQPNKGKQS